MQYRAGPSNLYLSIDNRLVDSFGFYPNANKHRPRHDRQLNPHGVSWQGIRRATTMVEFSGVTVAGAATVVADGMDVVVPLVMLGPKNRDSAGLEAYAT